MLYRKFEAVHMREALDMVKQTLGSDAMIISARSLPGTLLKPKRLEVIAAAGQPEQKDKKACGSAGKQLSDEEQAEIHKILLSDEQPASVKAPAASQKQAAAKTPEVAPKATPKKSNRKMLAEISGLRKQLHALQAAVETYGAKSDSASLQAKLDRINHFLVRKSMGKGELKSRSSWLSFFNRSFIDPRLASYWIAELDLAFPKKDAQMLEDDRASFEDYFNKLVSSTLLTSDDFFEQLNNKKVCLIGPTGVGKTTTIAKIAAHAALRLDKKVAIISYDYYRIGAYEQIKKYADLMSIPVKKCSTATQFSSALRTFDSYDLVLIDTAGRSPMWDPNYRDDLNALLPLHNIEVVGTFSAAMPLLELQQAVENIACFNPQRFVITKLDEAITFGILTNICWLTQRPISFLTYGQKVPEDIAVPNSTALGRFVTQNIMARSCKKQPLVPHISKKLMREFINAVALR